MVAALRYNRLFLKQVLYMGLFHVEGRLTGPTGRVEEVELLVDTGATLSVVPRSLAERLELKTTRSQRVVIAGGQRDVRPTAEARLALTATKSRLRALLRRRGQPCSVLLLSKVFFLRSIR